MTPAPAPGVDLIRLALQRAGRVRFRARGGSMRPFLHDGDLVSVVASDTRHVEIGEIICYEAAPDRLIVHRLIARDGADLVTRGDALPWVDRVPAERVLGRVVRIERAARLVRAAHRLRRLWGRLVHA